jgi:hypothetical protein
MGKQPDLSPEVPAKIFYFEVPLPMERWFNQGCKISIDLKEEDFSKVRYQIACFGQTT